MPLYYFHLLNGEGHTADEVGQELPDLEAARRHGLKALGQIVAEALGEGAESLRVTLFVDNEAGERLLTLPISARLGE
jgi:hypothetical protein